MKKFVNIVGIHGMVAVFVDGEYFGSAVRSDSVYRRRGANVVWSVTVKDSDYAGRGFNKAGAVSKLKRLVREKYPDITYVKDREAKNE